MKYLRAHGQIAGSALIGLLLAAGVASCGGGTTDFAGIGGTGITANGRITGFGSIFVNGVEYDTDASKIVVGGQEAGQSALKLGMVVTVTGTVDANGQNGVANMVSYRAEIKGPAANPLIDTAGQTLTFTVLGVPVVADKGTTVFSADGYAGFGFATIAANDIVEISGFYDAIGRLIATHVEKAGVHAPGDPNSLTEVEIKGVISAFVANQNKFTLANGITVEFGSANVTKMPTDWRNLRVEIEGFLLDPTTIQAFRIEPVDRGLPHDADKVEIEGIVSAYQDLANFLVAGQAVNASGAGVRFEPAGLALADGMQVEVEGRMSGGVLIAREVKGHGGNIEIEAFVTAVDTNDKTITLAITPNNTATAAVDNQTLMKDETVGAVPNLGLADIRVGDFLEIEAYGDPTVLCMPDCTVLATHIKRISPETAVKLQGPVRAFEPQTAKTITILDITFGTKNIDPGKTQYKKDDQTITATAFFDYLGTNIGPPIVVKVKDTREGFDYVGDAIADKLEIDD